MDMSDQRRFGGLGMGLAIASRIALAHGGRITLKSEPGKGSTFAMWLPMRIPRLLSQGPDDFAVRRRQRQNRPARPV